VIPAVTAFSDSTTSQKFVYVSNTSTLTAGYATTQPADPLSVAGYNKGTWGSSAAATWSAPAPWNWYYSTDAPFGSGAYWISTAASTEVGSGDQWRLYKVDFDIPAGANITLAKVWSTADNAVAVHLNNSQIGIAGTVYGSSANDTTPVYQHAYNATFTPHYGSNTLKFVVRNWASPYTNPTGLLYKVAIEYEPPVPPVANYTATPISGNRPLTVQFTDSSIGLPATWSWDFGDGDSTNSTVQNATHSYASPGIYTVNQTVANAAGNDTKVRTDYVTVTGTVDYYVFADGIDLYHNYGGNTDLSGADTSAQGFYQHLATAGTRCHIDDSGTNYCWNERSNPVNDDTGSKYWCKTELADSIGANSAEFVYHAGHGGNDGILFGTENTYHDVFRSNMSFSRTKWAAFDSCSLLDASNQQNWDSVFDGLHILMSYETIGQIDEDTGPQFVERMKGGTYQGTPYLVTPIRYAWLFTLQDTVHNSTLWGAYKYAEPSGDDYLPGYGTFTEPVKNNGQYTIHWEHFQCI
jgi:PKD repeat protein